MHVAEDCLLPLTALPPRPVTVVVHLIKLNLRPIWQEKVLIKLYTSRCRLEEEIRKCSRPSVDKLSSRQIAVLQRESDCICLKQFIKQYQQYTGCCKHFDCHLNSGHLASFVTFHAHPRVSLPCALLIHVAMVMIHVRQLMILPFNSRVRQPDIFIYNTDVPLFFANEKGMSSASLYRKILHNIKAENTLYMCAICTQQAIIALLCAPHS